MSGNKRESRTTRVLTIQRSAFRQGRTLAPGFRRAALFRLLEAVERHQTEVEEALGQDLNKAPFESYMTEIGLFIQTAKRLIRRLEFWSARRHVPTPLSHFPADSFTLREPYGNVLIMAPWNYPFLLVMEPLAGALAAGNCCIVKPSEYAPATAAVVEKIVKEALPSWLAEVVQGEREVSEELLRLRFDYIFFTGSPVVGREVLKQAAIHLTPATLELGGKSPCIVDKSADLRTAAKRIVFGKFLNGGQTCVAPDYVLVHASVKKELIRWLRYWIRKQFGERPLAHADYPKIVNERHFRRILGLMEGQEILSGGGFCEASLQIEPTILDDPSWDSPVMREEIFGPILPVLGVDSIFEAERLIKRGEKPLALYLFTSRRLVEDYVLDHISFGGGCVNDTVLHAATPYLPFGGVGNSGMGRYHGKWSFETFSHEKGILKKPAGMDIPLRYRPYTKGNNRLLRLFLR